MIACHQHGDAHPAVPETLGTGCKASSCDDLYLYTFVSYAAGPHHFVVVLFDRRLFEPDTVCKYC